MKPATLLKKKLCHRCFPVNFVKFLRTPYLHLRATASDEYEFSLGQMNLPWV